MHCWARYLLIAVVTLFGVASMMGACGRKGPLYLPDQTPQSQPATGGDVPAPPPASAPADSERPPGQD